MSVIPKAPYSVSEEIANSVTHGVGIIFGIVGLALLLIKSINAEADLMTIISMSVYGVSIILLFTASTLYHAISSQKTRRVLKTLDHCAIYLLIAGSYTPFLLVSLRTPLAIGLMAIIWIIAIFGIVFKIFFVYKFKRLSLFTYLAMGWLSLIAIYQLAQNVEITGLLLLAGGGLVYSLGVVFYVSKRIPFNHAIWHGFVLMGCVCHFLAVYYFIEPI